MFDFVKNLNIVQQACQQFIKSHETFYSFSSQIVHEIGKMPNLRLQSQQVSTSIAVDNSILHNKIDLNIISNLQNSENCIVYLHGLSSYCIQGKFLIPFLGDHFSLCLYDSRGHGRNKASYVTYGLLESIELFQVLKFLSSKGYKNIILWGRSMGAVTCLRTVQKFKDQSMIRLVKYVVADSPFSSFKMIATELVSKMIMVPEFISSILADTFMTKINQKYGLNLKDINFESLKSYSPVAFLYSSKDQIMGKNHIQAITSKFVGERQIIDIEVSHNQERPKWIVVKLINNIKDAIDKKTNDRKSFDSKKRGLSITKISSMKYLNMVTPTSVPRQYPKQVDFAPPITFQRRQARIASKKRSKQNLDYYEKSTVQSISKIHSAQINEFSKMTKNRDNVLKNTIKRVTFDNYI